MSDDESSLLAASRAAYCNKNGSLHHEEFSDGTDMIMLGNEPHRPSPMAGPSRPLSLKQRGKQRNTSRDFLDQSLSDLEHGTFEKPRKPSRREVEAFRSKSAGPQWYDLPAFPGAKFSNSGKDVRTNTGKASITGGDARSTTEKELRRQVTAIRLRNALDPKRFYRGSGGTGAERGMPKFAQLGKIVGGGLEPSSILNRRQRSDSVVGELVHDAESVTYSKRKFIEVCSFNRVLTYSFKTSALRRLARRASTAANVEDVRRAPLSPWPRGGYHVVMLRLCPRLAGFWFMC
jgi:rRNA-processing protein fcf2